MAALAYERMPATARNAAAPWYNPLSAWDHSSVG